VPAVLRGLRISDKLGPMLTGINRYRLFLFLFCIGFSLPAAAEVVLLTDWRGERHMDCIASVARDPSEGMAEAEDWLERGGGPAARHCMAVAEARIGDPGKAAREFTALAASLPGDRWSDIGQLWGQAGNAWLLAEQPAHALEAFDEAVAELPTDWGLLADRAVTRALLADNAGAVSDLDRAIELAGPDPELLLYRATAFRRLGDYGSARRDLNEALRRAPRLAEAYLERGRVRVLQDDRIGAAEDWQMVLSLAPEGPLARQATEALRQLVGDD